MRAFLGLSQQQRLGDGCVVGHDGDIERQKPLAVGGVQVQLLQAVLLEQLLDLVQILQLDSLEEGGIALELRREGESHTLATAMHAAHFRLFPAQLLYTWAKPASRVPGSSRFSTKEKMLECLLSSELTALAS